MLLIVRRHQRHVAGGQIGQLFEQPAIRPQRIFVKQAECDASLELAGRGRVSELRQQQPARHDRLQGLPSRGHRPSFQITTSHDRPRYSVCAARYGNRNHSMRPSSAGTKNHAG
jgi:hypothetical protein